MEHPKAGKAKFIGGPVRFEGLVVEKSGPPPLPGEQTDSILAELGYSTKADIEKLSKAGAIQSAAK